MKIVFFSLTGNTRRFVGKIKALLPEIGAEEILPDDPEIVLSEPFILIVPCYERATTDPIWEFMKWAGNSQWCRGVIGGGNRNFAGLFIYTAKDLCADFDLPLLYAFEFAGMPQDAEFVRNWLTNWQRDTVENK